MKNYKTLKKEEKFKVKDKFIKTEYGAKQYGRFKRILIYGIILFIFAIYLLIDAIVTKANAFAYVASGISFVFSIFFIIERNIVMNKVMNNYLNKKK